MNNILSFISNNFILSTVWFFLLNIIIFLIFKPFYLKAKLVSNFDAIKLINERNAKIVDTRSLELYNSGHILNSIHIPLKNISFKKVQELNLSTLNPVILIINSSERNNKYIKNFLDNGIKNIYILKNGIASWDAENLPLVINKK
ncbi:rhodanese-like domain-containing protein [Buchnera aphidicola]|uniref:Rhodanese-like domain-containing protein n=1 Tax=Buchnera aphidicola (Aphis gossypii) TaxID=98785 RepID=A0A5J6ZBB2_9GAMM|nr:rhodanese-like domain-containing protein [Buchnera aphidicola]QFQ31907.1 rhodanese-like domain-containing protein [Buchnera aphidicola (Aphis gossypii)]UPT14440.1 rhodanese-like domain-containing protein [Buchnera aphidicola (Aphis gossypii)]